MLEIGEVLIKELNRLKMNNVSNNHKRLNVSVYQWFIYYCYGKNIAIRSLLKDVRGMHEENFFKGMLWATLLSVPLWLSFFGWMKLTLTFLRFL